LNVSWLGVFLVLGRLIWGDEKLGFLSGESLLDLWERVGNHLGLSVSGSIRGGVGLGELNVVVLVEGWDMVSLAGSPVIDVLLVLDGLGLSTSWGSGVRLLGGVALEGDVGGGVSLGQVLLVVGRSVVSFTATPVLDFLRIFNFLGFSTGWRLRFFVSVQLRLGLQKVAVGESALDEVEEVTDEFRLLLLTDTLEKLRVHFLLEVLVHIDFEIGLQESLFSHGDLMHVSVHAHSLDFGHHLSLRLKLGGFDLSGGSQQKESSESKFHVLLNK